jgi:hypothetical protein
MLISFFENKKAILFIEEEREENIEPRAKRARLLRLPEETVPSVKRYYFNMFKEIIEVLSVFEEATLQFCQEDSTCSIILPTLIFLRKFLDRKTVESEAAKELVSSFKHALDSRIISVRYNDVLNVAMLLDPRFSFDPKLKTESEWKAIVKVLSIFIIKSL